ncbi:Hint domain-containing protein [Roseobacter sp.]|uniref:Hint domain-containing protein n=1 Tax=Roseobacter sp. TaxID=1907202 RepID=UPI003297433B
MTSRPSAHTTPADHHTRADIGFAGLVSGAHVLSLKGEQPVEALGVGDHVLTRSGAVRIRHIDVVSVVVPTVYVIAGSLGHARTDRDALLTADQTVYLHDWRALALYGQHTALARIGDLIDGEFVRDLGQQVVTVYRIFCAMPRMFYADGLEVGTADAVHRPLNRRAA